MLRRGLGYEEMMSMPAPMFFELQMFDDYLEPQGPQVDDMRQAMTQHALYASSGNLTKKGLKEMKVTDFLLRNPDKRVFKTPEEIAADKAAAERARLALVEKSLSKKERDQLIKLKQRKVAKNGKE